LDLNLVARNVGNGHCEVKTPLYSPSKIFHKHSSPHIPSKDPQSM
jgi:hypothetical protein